MAVLLVAMAATAARGDNPGLDLCLPTLVVRWVVMAAPAARGVWEGLVRVVAQAVMEAPVAQAQAGVLGVLWHL